MMLGLSKPKMIDFNKIKTYPLKERRNLVKLSDMNELNDKVEISKEKGLKELTDAIIKANKKNKKIILMMGGHVIKTGMSRYIIDLMKKGIINHVAMNGACSIHDFELAYIGETSEDVAENIENGSFGMIEETGKYLNDAIKQGAKENIGYGEAVGRMISEKKLKNKEISILANAYELGIPATVHVAIGTDIIHQHPSCDGAAIGKTSYQDFKIFTDSVSKMDEGVVINLGSAVILPEVFLKAITIARNLGYKVEKITAANIDMFNHYRPRVNVVERPTSLGGKGIIIIEKHQKSVPTLYKLILEGLNAEQNDKQHNKKIR
ncbi:MAG: hypothetical protein Q8O89_04975 [Nanoarchaeota archaeon]|nr:hypothetical protein [Nanoarchaeota archaeon]